MPYPQKKILFLFTRSPYPANDGTKLKILSNILEGARGRYQCTIAIISDAPADPKGVAYLEERYGVVKYFHRPRFSRIWNALLSWISGAPLQAGFFYSKKVALALDEEIKAADVVYAHTLRFGKYLEALPLALKRKVLFDFNDAISFNYHDARRSASGFWKIIYALEAPRLMSYEQRMLANPFYFSIVSEADRDYLLRIAQKNGMAPAIDVNEHGVRDELLEIPNPYEGKSGMVTMGNMFYPPNLDAIRWSDKLLRALWPAGSAPAMDAVGRFPEGLDKECEKISFKGFVDDPDAFIVAHEAFMAPLRFGAGVQTKVLDAMALGMPVITSPVGARGVHGARDGKNMLIVDMENKAGWKSAIETLLHDPALRKKIGSAARELIRETHTASAARERFRRAIEAIAK